LNLGGRGKNPGVSKKTQLLTTKGASGKVKKAVCRDRLKNQGEIVLRNGGYVSVPSRL